METNYFSSGNTKIVLSPVGLGLSGSLSYGFMAQSVARVSTDYERLRGSSSPVPAETFRMDTTYGGQGFPFERESDA
jgi:hypothetical protein